MNLSKVSIAVVFLGLGGTLVHAQVKNDSVKKERKIEGVTIQGTRNQKTESATILQQKKATVQLQAMGAEEMSRKGISNIQQSLVKLTGITSVEGRGLFVRGLEERYNTLLINGLGSPSNNPFQKIIELKQFPTDVVGKLDIYKTFNSDLYADFAGATFDINTLNYEKPFTKIEFSVGVNTQNTFRKNFKISENANTFDGYLGLNSKDRQLPSEIDGYKPSNYNFTKNESLNSFKDSWNVDNATSLPNTGISFTTAQRAKLNKGGQIGYLLSLNQSSSYEYKNGANNMFFYNGGTSPITYNNKLNLKDYEYNTESSVLLGIGFKKKKTNVMFNGIFLQNTSNMIKDYRGYKNNSPDNKRFFRVNQMDISRFTDLQLVASHKIGDRHELKAGGSWVNNIYQQPDRKIFDGILDESSNQITMTYGSSNLLRQYLDVNGKNYFSAFAEYKVGVGNKGDKKEYPIQLALGYNGFADIRTTSYRFISSVINAVKNPNINVTTNVDSPQKAFDESAENGAFHYKEESLADYKNHMYQFVNAGYLNLNYKPDETWDILVGGRIENNMNITRYKKSWDNFNDSFRNLTKDQYFILPSLSIKKELTNKTNLRFAASKTITRPILIEYMPIRYVNPDNEYILGNENLENSENYNFDLKFETFPTKDELFSATLFAKRIDNAIEKSYIASGDSNGQTITFYNAKKADLAGIELEGIISLRRLTEILENFTLGVNTTFMYSNVERSPQQQEQESAKQKISKRGLQGAAPWTLNADLKYSFPNAKRLERTMSLVYNVSGPKIHTVGSNGVDHVYEEPFNQLDFIYINQLNKNWSLKFAVNNILNSHYKLEIGNNSDVPLDTPNNILKDYYRGTEFKVTVGYTF